MIIWDHAIFHLQKAGGITTWWKQHCAVMSPRISSDIGSMALPESLSLSLALDLPGRYTFDGQLPGAAWFLKDVACPSGSTLFHSSYFRVPRSGPRSLLTYHDASMLRHGGWRGKLHRWLQERCLRRADLIHCVSHHAKAELLSEFPWANNKPIRVVYHGISLANMESTRPQVNIRRPFVLFVGQRDGYKRGDLAIRALACTLDLDLILVGGGGITYEERRIIAKLGIEDRVHACGRVPQPNLRWLYQHAEALWYPSNNEGFGFPVLEAASVGCPVLAAAGHAVQEIAGDYAILSPAPSPEWIASAMGAVRTVDRCEWKLRGESLVSRFTWDAYAEQMSEIYDQIKST